jgi:cell division protein FtsW (lipid II flippase)
MLTQTQGIPTAISHLVFSEVALCLVALALYSGAMSKMVDFIERKTGALFWGFLSFAFLALPLFLGKPVGGTFSWLVGNSVQPSELVFKVSFAIFLAKFLTNREFEITPEGQDPRWLLMPLGVLIFLTTVFFFVPLVLLQREFGTALMISITLIVVMTVATGRWIFLAAGVVTMVLAISLAVLVSHRVEERIVGGFLNWREYAFREYFEGSGNWPGYQVFKSLAAVDSAAIWGTGLCKGITRVSHATTDYIAIPIMEEFGIIGLLILLASFLLFIKETFSGPLKKDFVGFLLICLPFGILCQAFYNLSGVLAMVAFTGIPIPFVSNGGSAILSNYLLVGVLSAALQMRRDLHLAETDPWGGYR